MARRLDEEESLELTERVEVERPKSRFSDKASIITWSHAINSLALCLNLSLQVVDKLCHIGHRDFRRVTRKLDHFDESKVIVLSTVRSSIGIDLKFDG